MAYFLLFQNFVQSFQFSYWFFLVALVDFVLFTASSHTSDIKRSISSQLSVTQQEVGAEVSDPDVPLPIAGVRTFRSIYQPLPFQGGETL